MHALAASLHDDEPRSVAVELQNADVSSLFMRTLRVNDELSLDNGRIRIRLKRVKAGRLSLLLQLDPEVVVDRPKP